MDKIAIQFELGEGMLSYLISRFGFSAGGWSHVRPLLPDGTSIDSYEEDIVAPQGGWGDPRFPQVIPAGVQHRPASWRPLKRSCVVELTVSDAQARTWESNLWAGVGLPYDHKAIEGFILGGDRHLKHADICSAWSELNVRKLGIGFPSPVRSHEVGPDMHYYGVTRLGGTVK
jgi:hypothetical protein